MLDRWPQAEADGAVTQFDGHEIGQHVDRLLPAVALHQQCRGGHQLLDRLLHLLTTLVGTGNWYRIASDSSLALARVPRPRPA